MKPSVVVLLLAVALVGCHESPPPAVAVPVGAAAPSQPASTQSAQSGSGPAPTAVKPASSAPPISPGSVAIGLIEGPPLFDPMPALEAAKPAFLKCFADARLIAPELHGKLTLEVHVVGSGAVSDVSAKPGGKATDPGLVGCVGDVLKGVTFPKPAGLATITIPMVFRQ